MQALVVDDSSAMRRIQQKALESLGWQVRCAANGREALVTLDSMPVCDLVLTDWHMPEMDGIELCAQLRRDARYLKLRIVMVTSDAVLDSVETALAAGANDFLMKPFSAEALSERIAGIFGG